MVGGLTCAQTEAIVNVLISYEYTLSGCFYRSTVSIFLDLSICAISTSILDFETLKSLVGKTQTIVMLEFNVYNHKAYGLLVVHLLI